jgi:hypothetical protein
VSKTQPQTQTRHHEQLSRLADEQLAALSTHDICASTVHLILAVAFFTGAAIGLAKQLRQPKNIYLASLRSLLQTRFGLEAHNASGMIESNARLYKRYVLIEKIYNAGLQAALAGRQPRDHHALKSLLTEYADLSMSGLNIEGTKEPSSVPSEVAALEEIAPIISKLATQPSHRGRTLFLLLMIALITSGAFFLFYRDGLAAMFPDLQPVVATWIERLMKDVVEPVRQWLEQLINMLRDKLQ